MPGTAALGPQERLVGEFVGTLEEQLDEIAGIAKIGNLHVGRRLSRFAVCRGTYGLRCARRSGKLFADRAPFAARIGRTAQRSADDLDRVGLERETARFDRVTQRPERGD